MQVLQINNLTLITNGQGFTVKAPNGKRLEQFSTSGAAIEWMRETKDFVKRR